MLRQGMNTDSLKMKEQREDRIRQSQIESQIDDIESRYQSTVDTWNRMRSKVMKIYEELHLDMPNDIMIRSDDGVTESNVLKYLAAIERKASEILAAIREEDDDDNNDEQDDKHPTSLAKKGEYGTSLVLPSATVIGNEYNSQVDDDVRPFTMKELQQSLRMLEGS